MPVDTAGSMHNPLAGRMSRIKRVWTADTVIYQSLANGIALAAGESPMAILVENLSPVDDVVVRIQSSSDNGDTDAWANVTSATATLKAYGRSAYTFSLTEDYFQVVGSGGGADGAEVRITLVGEKVGNLVVGPLGSNP